MAELFPRISAARDRQRSLNFSFSFPPNLAQCKQTEVDSKDTEGDGDKGARVQESFADVLGGSRMSQWTCSNSKHSTLVSSKYTPCKKNSCQPGNS